MNDNAVDPLTRPLTQQKPDRNTKSLGFPARSDQPRQVKDYTRSSSYKKLTDAALTKDPESTQAENSSTCRDTYLGRQGKYNRECDMISIFFQTPLDQERVKPRLKTIGRADPKPKHTKSTWSTSLSREKSCFIKITLLYDF
ncbi:hypothetical protein V6N13_059656 [Hibiscus sabdariffa]